ncbi:MAG: glycoside hydrolase family 127 protein [Defluviitaleaceae bacterium]|nr:glycoside hydrolase family 127 protein [Defluviitaleaceae bacterium]
MTKKILPLSLKDITVGGSFWSRYMELIRKEVIPYQWDILNDRIPDAARSSCIKNFEIAAGRVQDEFYGMVFQDSDLYKWLESVAYTLAVYPDAELEKLADDVITLIGEAQGEDGYVNTHYRDPKTRWTNLQHGHELYCAGHLIEAAVAYHDATGKAAFLEVAKRFADCIDSVFGEGKKSGYPGHQEIELALYKLFEVTKEKKYLNLAAYFINERGKKPYYFLLEQQRPTYKEVFPELTTFGQDYYQAVAPPFEQKVAMGHSVRAVYMYSAMADLASEQNDKALADACEILYRDITEKQMYVTGAIGSASIGERFTSAYDLPNDLIYGETCASVGLMMFCRRMNAMYGDAKYADTMEIALYNTVLAGISLDGKGFFYVNPLEVEPKKVENNPNYKHIKPVRPKWFDCACCPSNLARTVMGLGLYAYGKTDEGLYVNLYCEGSAKDGMREINVSTSYPFGDTATLTVQGGSFDVYLRNPQAAPVKSVKINGRPMDVKTENGYMVVTRDWKNDTIEIIFDMAPRYIYSVADVQVNAGKAAVMRGPIVYCAEQVDNGELLSRYVLDDNAPLTEVKMPQGLLAEGVALQTKAYSYDNKQTTLYGTTKPTLQPCDLKLIPYFMWANRGENEMRVYLGSLALAQ